MSLVNVEGYTHLKKDLTTGAVVNVDKSGYKAYKQQKQFAAHREAERQRMISESEATNNRVTDLENQINSIKDDISDIKTMLVQIMGTKN